MSDGLVAWCRTQMMDGILFECTLWVLIHRVNGHPQLFKGKSKQRKEHFWRRIWSDEDWWHTLVIPKLRRLRQQEHELEARQGYVLRGLDSKFQVSLSRIVRSCLKKQGGRNITQHKRTYIWVSVFFFFFVLTHTHKSYSGWDFETT